VEKTYLLLFKFHHHTEGRSQLKRVFENNRSPRLHSPIFGCHHGHRNGNLG